MTINYSMTVAEWQNATSLAALFWGLPSSPFCHAIHLILKENAMRLTQSNKTLFSMALFCSVTLEFKFISSTSVYYPEISMHECSGVS